MYTKHQNVSTKLNGDMWKLTMYMASNSEFVNPEKLKNAVPGPYEKYMLKKTRSGNCSDL